MQISIRAMRPEEANYAVKLAKKSFGILEGLFISKPKTAILAVDDDEKYWAAFSLSLS